MQICETDIVSWIVERDKELVGWNIEIKVVAIGGFEINRLRVQIILI